MTQASPLKTREYLCYGLPILITYTDCAQKFPELVPFIQHYPETTPEQLAHQVFDHQKIQLLARQFLNWEAVLMPVIEDFQGLV